MRYSRQNREFAMKNLTLILVLLTSVGCDSTLITNAQAGLVEDYEISKASFIKDTAFLREEAPVTTTTPTGNRNKTYDTLLPPDLYLSEDQAKPFILGWFAYPQELTHIIEILGVPHSEVGSDLYWRITASTELAATVEGHMVTQVYVCDGFNCIPTN